MKPLAVLMFLCLFQIQCAESESKQKAEKGIQIEIEIKNERMLREGWDEGSISTSIGQGKIDFFNAPLSSTLKRLLCDYQGLNCHDKNGRLYNKVNWKDGGKYFSIQGEYDETIIKSDVASYIFSELKKRQLFQIDTLTEELSIVEIIDLDTSIINRHLVQENTWSFTSNCSGSKPANDGGRLPPLWRSGKWKTHFKGGASIDEMVESVIYDCFGFEYKINELLSKYQGLNIIFDFKVSDSFDEIKNAFLKYGIKVNKIKVEKEVYILDLI